MKAIPTEYKGQLFRSRLEAKWAAFFDLLGWRWTYEPLDLEGWAPDFMLSGDSGSVYCEVKPIDLTSADVNAAGRSVDKLHNAAISGDGHLNGVRLMLLGLGPFRAEGELCLGGLFFGDPDGFLGGPHWGAAPLRYRYSDSRMEQYGFDFHEGPVGSYRGILFDAYDGSNGAWISQQDADLVERYWRQAGAIVMSRKPEQTLKEIQDRKRARDRHEQWSGKRPGFRRF